MNKSLLWKIPAVPAPINSAIKARQIGQAMIEVSARGPNVENGTIVENKRIIGYSHAYVERRTR